MAKLLIIDDSELILDMLGMALSDHDITRATDADSARAAVSRETFDLIVTDLTFPGLEAPNAVAMLRDGGSGETPIFIMSGRPAAELEAKADEFGVQGSVSKDLGLPMMASKIDAFLADL